MSREIICSRCLKTLPDMDGCHTCTPSPLVRSLESRIVELEFQLKETGDALLREDKRTREARKQAHDECVGAILNGSQFFLAGIEPEMREAVVRRALNINP